MYYTCCTTYWMTHVYFFCSFLQFFNSIHWYVFWACVYSFIGGFVANGIISIIIVALETRYALPSSRSGMIASSSNFGAFPFLIIVGYLGDRFHKPKLMSIGTFLLSLGCLLFALPHFIGGKYQYVKSG